MRTRRALAGRRWHRALPALTLAWTLACSGAPAAPTVIDASAPAGRFTLTSPAVVDGGTLPVDYTCDGEGASPALTWANPPARTSEFALLMSTQPGDGTTKWNWVLYGIPAAAAGLPRNSTGVGTPGVGSDGPSAAYQPPCSQGPGAKVYTFTLYALSAAPRLTGPAGRVTGAMLLDAIAPVTLGSAVLTVSYTRR